jgi:indole-3-glycerol phosphate synthase
MGPSCLKEVRKLTKKPLLRKDFIIDPYQIYEARYYGADAILLIATLLTKDRINNFIEIAKRYNMDCLVETHTKEELQKVLKTKAEIIGINNRNLDTLKIDLNTTINLAKKIPKLSNVSENGLEKPKGFLKNKIIVTESGYRTNKEIKKVKSTANAALIGTSILNSKDINKKINDLMG